MRSLVALGVAGMALCNAVSAEPNFNYGYLELDYIAPTTESKFFVATSTDEFSVDSDYKPDGFRIKLSAPFARNFFYDVSYYEIEDRVTTITTPNFTIRLNDDLELKEARLSIGYIIPVASNLDSYIKGTYIDGDFGGFDHHGPRIGGGVRFRIAEKFELNSELGYGKLEVEDDIDLFEFQLGGLYRLTDQVSLGLRYQYAEIDEIDNEDPSVTLVGIEEQQSLSASLRFNF